MTDPMQVTSRIMFRNVVFLPLRRREFSAARFDGGCSLTDVEQARECTRTIASGGRYPSGYARCDCVPAKPADSAAANGQPGSALCQPAFDNSSRCWRLCSDPDSGFLEELD
jgi:hypothetical protein